jgi:ATP-dependent RNA helicase DDX31/DBP7
LNEIKTGEWQKRDKELQKERKSGPQRPMPRSGPVVASSPSVASPEAKSDRMDVDGQMEKVEQKVGTEKEEDLKEFEPSSKKSKPLTSKQKLKEQESTYAQYVKAQNVAAKHSLPETKKGVTYQTLKELAKELDILSAETFSDLDLNPHLVDNIVQNMQLENPTQIQRYAIPVLLSRRDALIKAQTGSGKTLAYLIPIVQDIIRQTVVTPSSGEGMDVDSGDDSSSDSESDVSSEAPDIDSSSENDVSEHGEQDENDELSHSGEEKVQQQQKPAGGRVLKYRLGMSSSENKNATSSLNQTGEKGEAKPKRKTRRPPKLNLDRASGTHAIIISPTRELALQIYEVLRKLLRPFPQIVPGLIMGGEKRKSEKARLRKGVSILVATPGRLVDHLVHTQSFQHDKCRWLVLDEADRLLDMGFERDLTAIINALNEKKTYSKRQNVLASATLNREVNRLALLSLIKPVYISTGTEASSTTAASSSGDLKVKGRVQNEEDMDEFDSNIPEDERVHEIPTQLKQHVVVVDDKRKLVALIAIIRSRLKQAGTKMIVFFSNCDSVDFYYMLFSMVEVGVSLAKGKEKDRERLFPCSLFKLHGNLNQDVRSSTFQAFSACSSGVLLCTDVAARGLDVPAVNWIIQYDAPSDPAAYVHRIGRTARIGASGDAVLLLTEKERPYLDVLAKRQMSLVEVPQQTVLKELKVHLEPNPSNDPLHEAASLQHIIEKLIEASKQVELKNMAINAFQGFLKSYATHTKTTKHIFHIKNLHLGHLSRNFGLRDPPSTFGKTLQNAGLGKKEAQRIKERAREKERKKLKVQAPGVVTADEFSAM